MTKDSPNMKWARAINKVMGHLLVEEEDLEAVAKVVGDIRWETVQDAATICEDNGDEQSADEIRDSYFP